MPAKKIKIEIEVDEIWTLNADAENRAYYRVWKVNDYEVEATIEKKRHHWKCHIKWGYVTSERSIGQCLYFEKMFDAMAEMNAVAKNKVKEHVARLAVV